jgi:hypothetical protein
MSGASTGGGSEGVDKRGGVGCDEVPVAHTPPGGYGSEMPPRVLAGCEDPLVEWAPDLRGLWQVVSVDVDGEPAGPDHPAVGQLQRIEQCANRIVITAGGVIHDMRCDGREENGVHDVAEFDFKTPITVIATYENHVHTLRPVGVPVVVTRHLDGETMVWRYLTFTARLARVTGR